MRLFFLIFTFVSVVTIMSSQARNNNTLTDEELNQSMAVFEDFASIPEILRKNLQSKSTREQYILSVMNFLRRNGIDQVKLTVEGLREKEKEALLNTKKQQITSTLQYDENLDGEVSFEEAKTAILKKSPHLKEKRYARNFERIFQNVTKLDKNGDSVISHKEMRDLSDEWKNQITNKLSPYKQYLALDPNKDGVLTGNELEEIARKAFAVLDKNNDGIISVKEREPYTKAQKIYGGRNIISKEQCSIPKVSDNMKLMAVGVYEGRAISTVTAIGQDKKTTAIKIRIEDNQPPTYLILSSFDPIMWQFEGNVGAIKYVVVGSSQVNKNMKSGSGVIGIDKDKITFAKRKCVPYFYNVTSPRILLSKGSIRLLTGRMPDAINGSYGVREVNISDNKITFPVKYKNKEVIQKAIIINPSDKPVISGRLENIAERWAREDNKYKIYIPPAPQGYDKALWNDFVSYNPGGIVKIDASKVVSDEKAENYDVLPKMAGIIKLIHDGFIEKIDNRQFRIIKDIPWFPAGLSRRVTVTLIIAKGVKKQQGSPGRSCVIMEETGEVVGHKIFCR